jgi:hypothetical protein
MFLARILLVLALILLAGGQDVSASSLVIFPKAERLVFLDGKYEVRNAET